MYVVIQRFNTYLENFEAVENCVHGLEYYHPGIDGVVKVRVGESDCLDRLDRIISTTGIK